MARAVLYGGRVLGPNRSPMLLGISTAKPSGTRIGMRVTEEPVLLIYLQLMCESSHTIYPARIQSSGEVDIETNADQVRNVPDDVTALVIPVGSGVSARGILAGVERFRPNLKIHLIQPFGYNREIPRTEGVDANYWKGDYNYAKPLHVSVGGIQLDQIYEAKAYDYMARNLEGVLRGERVCFWLIGDANEMRISA